MGLEGALFTFPLCMFEKINLNFKYLTCNLFLCTSPLINLEYIALNKFDNSRYPRAASAHVSPKIN
jgi:hypothetical protein